MNRGKARGAGASSSSGQGPPRDGGGGRARGAGASSSSGQGPPRDGGGGTGRNRHQNPQSTPSSSSFAHAGNSMPQTTSRGGGSAYGGRGAGGNNYRGTGAAGRGGYGRGGVGHHNGGGVACEPTKRQVTDVKSLLRNAFDEKDCSELKEELLMSLAACARSSSDTDAVTNVFTFLSKDEAVAKMMRNFAIMSKSVVIFEPVDRTRFEKHMSANASLCPIVLTVLGKCLDTAVENRALQQSIITFCEWVPSEVHSLEVRGLLAKTNAANIGHVDAQELNRRRAQHTATGESSRRTYLREEETLVMNTLDVFPSFDELKTPVHKQDAVDRLYSVDTVPFKSLQIHFDTQYQLLRADFCINFCHGFQLAYFKLKNPSQRGEKHERNMSARVYTDVVLAPSAFSLDRFKGITFTFYVDWRQFGPNFNRVNAKKRFMDGNLIVVSPNFTSNNPELHMGVVVNISDRDRTDMRLPNYIVPFRVSFNKPFFKFVEGSVDYKFTVVESSDFFLATHAVLNVLKTADPEEVPLPIVKALRGEVTEVPAYISANPRLSIKSAIACNPPFDPVSEKNRLDAEHARLVSLKTQIEDLSDTPEKIALVATFKSAVLKYREDTANYNENTAGNQQEDDVRTSLFWKSLSSWSPELENSLAQKAKKLPVQKVHALDHTQAAGMRHIFNNNVAIVQGTPGTGKTFIGAKFVQLLLDNKVKCGPILVLCFTNHALDSFLHSLIPLTAKPEEDIVRLGGSSKDEEMKKYALLNRLRGLPYDQRIRDLQSILDSISSLNNPTSATSDESLSQLALCRDPSILAFQSRVITPWIEDYKMSVKLNSYSLQIEKLRQKLRSLDVETTNVSNDDLIGLSIPAAIDGIQTSNISTESYVAFQEEELKKTQSAISALTALPQASVAAGAGSESAGPVGAKKKKNKNKRKNGNISAVHKKEAAEKAAKMQELRAKETAISKDISAQKASMNAARTTVIQLLQEREQLVQLVADSIQCQNWFAERSVDPIPKADARVVSDADNNNALTFWWIHWLKSGGAFNRGAKSLHVVNRPGNEAPSLNEVDCGDNDMDDDDAVDRQIEDELAHEAADAREVEEADDGVYGINATDIPNDLLALARTYLTTTTPQKWNQDECATAFHSAQILATYILKQQLQKICVEIDTNRGQLLRVDARRKADVMKNCKIVGATTIGAVRDLQALRLLKPKVVIVEECAEVLESHILASLTSEIQHLILIGDHLQLKPKVSDFGIEKKGLGMSLMERLVLTKKIPFVTLHQQRRMHPDISELTKNYYRRKVKVEIEDHPSVFVNRAPMGGVDPKLRVAWINTRAIGAVEAMHPGMQSPFNSKEAELSLCIAEYLMHQEGLSPSQITILVPYTGQLMEVMGKYRSCNLPQGLRIVTIDNFQGEENDVIIVSLTRTLKPGFLDIENRACVCLSRARRGMFILGDADLLEKSRNMLWTDTLEGCRTRDQVFSLFKGVCKPHGTPIQFSNFQNLKSACGPNFGCYRECGTMQSCGHACKQACHSSPCEKNKCKEKCCRVGKKCNPPRTCDHPCSKKCAEDCGPCTQLVPKKHKDCEHFIDTRCCDEPSPCKVPVDRVLPCGHPRKLPCHVDPLTYKCGNMVPGTLTECCGHTVDAACWKWTTNSQASIVQSCKNACATTFHCGHSCPDPCHFGKPCMPCTQLVPKKHKDCEHFIDTRCCDEPSPCKVPVDRVLPCGHPNKLICSANVSLARCHTPVSKHLDELCNHLNEASCWMWVEGLQPAIAKTCKHTCGVTMECGHQCVSTCHVARPLNHPPCVHKVSILLSCGHNGVTSCSAQTLPKCSSVCGETLECGHVCNLKCHPSGTPHEVCNIPTTLHLPCSHTLEHVPCHLQFDLEKAKRLCKEPCTFIHACGHTCGGTCGTCRGSFHYLDHKKCSELCGRILPLCGHQCKGSCTKDCPSCVEVCSQRCTHSDCGALGKKTGRHKCGACTAPLCRMPCEWVCPHKTCTLTCHEECNRDACMERCGLQLGCGHQCSGLCGEACPQFCVDCFKNRDAGEERDAEIDRFTLLGTLSHTENVEALQTYLTSRDINRTNVLDNAIHALQCGCTFFVSELLSHVKSHVSQPKVSALLCPTLGCRMAISPSDFRIARVDILRHKNALSAAQKARKEARNDRVVSVRDTLISLQAQILSLTGSQGTRGSSSSTTCIGDISWLLHPPQEPSEPSQPPPPRNFSKLPPTPKEKADHKTYQLRQQQNKQPVAGIKEWLSRNVALDRSIYMKNMEEFHVRKVEYDSKLNQYDERRDSLLTNLGSRFVDVPTFVFADILDNAVRASELQEQGDSCTSQDTELIDALARRSGLLVDVMCHHERLLQSMHQKSNGSKELPIISSNVYVVVDEDDNDDDDPAVCGFQIQKMLRGWLAARASIALQMCKSLGGTSTDFDNNHFGQLMRAGQQFLGTNWRGHGNAPMPVVVNNRCNESGCVAYKRFMRGVELACQNSLGAGGVDFMGVKVRFGFHGTSPDGIPGICCEGFDVRRRSGQAFGPGEYFADGPSMSEGYARGEAQMLLCVIIEGPWMRLPGNGMIVVNNPVNTPDIAFSLPIGVLVYNNLNTCVEFSKGCRAKPRISKVMVDNLAREWRDLSVPWNTSELSKKIADAEEALGLPNPQYTFSKNATTAVEAANLPEGGQNYYRCPQGHIFSVGDCGSVMDGTRCPVCGVDIEVLF